ncbi:MAG: ferrous iron transport protein A [Oscillospiraceae bacterium]|nr:MAG: ferrous iron transport protein A [Oscillospiraceae bacterium]
MYCLNDIAPGERARVVSQSTCGALRRRLLDMGLIAGTEVECVGKSPAGDPRAYLIRGAVIALRDEDCRRICVERGGTVWG